MIKSMTGFGKSEAIINNKKITVEVKSLNSKQLDLNFRTPYLPKELEFSIRNKISNVLKRGKVDLCINIEYTDDSKIVSIPVDIVKAYCNQVIQLHESLNLPVPEDIVLSVLKFPEIFKTEKQELTQEEQNTISSILDLALEGLEAHRTNEGEVLGKDILQRVDLIENLLESVQPFEAQRIELIRNRIEKHLADFASKDKSIDVNRLEQELIFYLEKLDITEEKVRLKNHCVYFKETADKELESGRKLAFIAQEMGREINTLGSKANNSDIQKIVVKMKDELEKIKEQILNVL